MTDAIIVLLKAAWDKTHLWSLAGGALAGFYGQPLFDLIWVLFT